MKLSELLEKYRIEEKFEMKNEKNFDTLALTQSDIRIPNCTFVDDKKYVGTLNDSVRMVLTTSEISRELDLNRVGLCIVDNPRNTYFKLHNALKDCSEYVRPTFKTKIGENTTISKWASIAENNVIIGDNVIIDDFVMVHANTTIGDNCIIRSGVKLGSVDFEFKRDGNEVFGVEHYGGLVLRNNVEIQCNTVVNRALYPWDNTTISEFTKIDANVMISHGVKIGARNMIVAGSVIGGRTLLGDDCWVGLSATLKNGISVGNGARINLGAVVTKNVAAGESVTGNFAIDHDKFLLNLKGQLKE